MDDNYYLAFSVGFPQDMARRIFVKKFGVEPERVFVEKGLLRVGPEPRRTVAEIIAELERDK